jgi:hypothetical protein
LHGHGLPPLDNYCTSCNWVQTFPWLLERNR